MTIPTNTAPGSGSPNPMMNGQTSANPQNGSRAAFSPLQQQDSQRKQAPNNNGTSSSVSGGLLMTNVPVQQTFSGPASTFINVFQQPGTYDINVNFQPHGFSSRFNVTTSQGGHRVHHHPSTQ